MSEPELDDCRFKRDGEPCWGEVTAIDWYTGSEGDEIPIYACEGHEDCEWVWSNDSPRKYVRTGEYIPKPEGK